MTREKLLELNREIEQTQAEYKRHTELAFGEDNKQRVYYDPEDDRMTIGNVDIRREDFPKLILFMTEVME